MFSTKLQPTTPKTRQPTVAALVMPFKDLFLATPVGDVRKVIRMPEIYKSGQKTLGLTHFGDREAIVVDLHQKIYQCPNPQFEKYLVVIQAEGDRLFGIPATTLPTLMHLPQAEFKELPAAYREFDTLGIASHLVTLETGHHTQTIFLLDPTRIFITQPSNTQAS